MFLVCEIVALMTVCMRTTTLAFLPSSSRAGEFLFIWFLPGTERVYSSMASSRPSRCHSWAIIFLPRGLRALGWFLRYFQCLFVSARAAQRRQNRRTLFFFSASSIFRLCYTCDTILLNVHCEMVLVHGVLLEKFRSISNAAGRMYKTFA